MYTNIWSSKKLVLLALAFIMLLVSALYPVTKANATPGAVYQTLLGKSLDDSDVAGFLASNRCSDVGQFQLCSTAGMALLVGEDRKVETVYLYPNPVGSFTAYQGALPLGLSASDTMAGIEHKLGQPKVQQAPQAGWEPGLPDESGTPDHVHTWAAYKRFGLTVVYNSPSALDKNATVYAVLINQ